MILRLSFEEGESIDLAKGIPDQIKAIIDAGKGRIERLSPRSYQLTPRIPEPNYNYWLTVHNDDTATLLMDPLKETSRLINKESDGVNVTDEMRQVVSRDQRRMIPIIGRTAPYEFRVFEVIFWSGQ